MSITAAIGEFVKSLNQITKAVEEMADDVASSMGQAAGAIGDFSDGLLTAAAAAGAAVAGAAEYSLEAKEASDKLKKSMLQLTSEVGTTFLPLVRELNQGVRTLTATWRGLSSETKAQIVEAVRYAAVLGVAGKATSMALTWSKSLAEGTVLATKALRTMGPAVVTGFSAMAKGATSAATAFTWLMNAPIGAITASIKASMASLATSVGGLNTLGPSLASTFGMLKSNILAVGAPILAVAAAVAALVLLAGSIRKTWKDSSTGLRDSVMEIIGSIGGFANGVADTFTRMFDAFMEFVFGMAEGFLEVLAAKVRAVARFGEDIARILGKTTWMKNLAQVQQLTGAGLVKVVKDQVSGVVDAARAKLKAIGESLKAAGKEAGEAITYGFLYSSDGAKDILKDLGLADLPAKLQQMLGGVQLGDPNTVEKAQTLEDRDKLWEEYVKTLDATQQRMLSETGEEAKRALEAEERALTEMLQTLEASATAEAEMAQANAEAVTEALAEAHRARVAELNAAAEMSAEIANEARQLAEEVQQRMREARQALVGKLTSSLGEITGILESVGQGFAAGGFWGALIALVGELLSRSEAFQSIITLLNDVIQLVADVLGELLSAVGPLVGAISMVAQAVMGALTPIFTWLGKAIEPLTPVLVMVAHLVESLAPIFEMLAGVLRVLEMPVKLLESVVLRALFEGLKQLSMGILWVAQAIGGFWNGVVTAVQSVLNALGNIELFGSKPFDFLLDWGTSLNEVKVETDALADAYGRLHDMTWETAQAQAEQAAAVNRNNEALREATEALTNVPPAWRAARARYFAQDAQGPGGVDMGFGVPGSSGASSTLVQQQSPVVVHQTITTYSPEDTARKVRKQIDELNFRRSGSRAGVFGGA